MIRMIKWLGLAILLSTLCGTTAHAQTTINATSCSSTAVQTALNSVAADGTTVVIPAGTCTWSSTVRYTANHSVTIQGQTTVTGTCAPGGSCVATDNTSILDATGSAALHVTSVNGKSLRITGLSFIWSSGAQEYVGMLFVDGSTQSLRIDHNHFYHANIVDLTVQGNKGPLLGVADHNMFNAGGSNEDAFRVEHYNWSGTEVDSGYSNGLGNASWADASYWGSNKFFFVENNTFAFDGGNSGHAFAFDCDAGGGRMVFRYNNVTPNMALQTHGTGSSDHNYRSCRAMEMYGNSFVYNSNPGTYNFFALLMLEGGGLYFWNNTITGFKEVVDMDYVRSNTLTYAESTAPGDWGYCSASPINGVPGPSPWDLNQVAGGPCVDQTGRGKGDLITGNFPSKIDSVSGTQSWPNQVSDPAYLWGNTYNPVPSNPNYGLWNATASSSVVQNRDYFLEIPNYSSQGGSFNGTAGIGCGPSSGVGCSNPVPQPSTCTPFVGYWNPSTSTLYQCSSANTWTAYYTPYTYPHPLTGSSGTPPAPPTGLAAVVN